MSRTGYVVAGGVLAVGFLAALIVTAFLLGRSSVTQVDWRTGAAHVGVRQVSVEHDGWTYGAVGSVPMWFDTRGSLHDGGWPDCLRGGLGTVPDLRFAATTVEIDDLGYRPIVAVDCRTMVR